MLSSDSNTAEQSQPEHLSNVSLTAPSPLFCSLMLAHRQAILCLPPQETDVAVKALRGLEELSRLVKMAPEAMRSDPYALNSWLANSGSLQESGSVPIMQSLEREVLAPPCRASPQACATVGKWATVSM